MGRHGTGRSGRRRGGGLRPDTIEREELEHRLRPELEREDALGARFTGHDQALEPFHRWLAYRQGFSPRLVRSFLAEAELPAGPEPILDPFNGSGTTTTECAREGYRALGVEAVWALARLSSLDALGEEGTAWAPPAHAKATTAWNEAPDALARTALLYAEASRYDGEGHVKGDAPSLEAAYSALLPILIEDLSLGRSQGLVQPLVLHGDARRLPLASATVRGLLTSPPYLSRYDYTRINAPLDRMLGRGRRRGERAQVRASRSARGVGSSAAPHPAFEEGALALEAEDRHEDARSVRAYARDMDRALAEMARVLRPGAPAWMVVAGSEVRKVLIPTDLALTELAVGHGFQLERIRVGRDMRPVGRRLGRIHSVAPRESLIQLRRG